MDRLEDLVGTAPIEQLWVQLTRDSTGPISKVRISLIELFLASLEKALAKKVLTTDPIKLKAELGDFLGESSAYINSFPNLVFPLEDRAANAASKSKNDGLLINVFGDISKGLTIYYGLSYELIARAADEIFESVRFVTWLQVAKRINYKGDGEVIGNYLHRWAEEREMESEIVTMGRRDRKHGGPLTAYYKGERPPVSPTERVKAAVGKKRNVHIGDIIEKASLPGLELTKKAAQNILPSLRYIHQGEGLYRLNEGILGHHS